MKFLQYYGLLKRLKRTFDVIAISETWLRNDTVEDFGITGYEMFFLNRTLKKGGGVALYVNTALQCKQVVSMSKECVGNFEIVTVEIEIKTSRNLIVSCVYRAPGTCIDKTKDQLVCMFEKVVGRKNVFVCGDFNVDL